MSTAWVLVTALPPTVGHLHLIQFASHVTDRAGVIVCTQPGEPYPEERVAAIREATASMANVTVHHLHATMPQEPEDNLDFWTIWVDAVASFGMARGGDYFVASEAYGRILAEFSANTFVPYDQAREISSARGSRVRADPLARFADVLPGFQRTLTRRVTILGAESTGKTTLSRDLAAELGGHWLPEWARPYLEEEPTPDVTLERMHMIRRGQRALQLHGRELCGRPFMIQDTDLFATIGYWRLWDAESMPTGLVEDAVRDTSDLYLVTRSVIPFEPDPLRYGGNRRESSDQYWIDLAEEFGLRLAVIEESDREERTATAASLARELFIREARLDFRRRGEH